MVRWMWGQKFGCCRPYYLEYIKQIQFSFHSILFKTQPSYRVRVIKIPFEVFVP